MSSKKHGCEKQLNGSRDAKGMSIAGNITQQDGRNDNPDENFLAGLSCIAIPKLLSTKLWTSTSRENVGSPKFEIQTKGGLYHNHDNWPLKRLISDKG